MVTGRGINERLARVKFKIYIESVVAVNIDNRGNIKIAQTVVLEITGNHWIDVEETFNEHELVTSPIRNHRPGQTRPPSHCRRR